MQELFGNLWNLQWQQVVMWGIGGLLIWLAIKKEMEPFSSTCRCPVLLPRCCPPAPRSARWMCCLMLALPTNCSRCCCLWALVQ